MSISSPGIGFFTCLSTDEKPENGAGCLLWEVDTGKKFKWVSNVWEEEQSSGLSQAEADLLYEPISAAIQAHVQSAHAPSNAQKNSDITKAEIEAKLTGQISSHTHAGGGGADVKSGLVNLTAGGSANVTFTTPFSSVPRVVVTAQINNADTSCTYSAHTVTVNGFSLRGAGNPAGNVAWLATNAGNS